MPQPVNSVHRSELYVDLLRRHVNTDLPYEPPRLHLRDSDFTDAVTLLGHFGLTAEQPYVAIAFQAVAESRRWGEENYRQLITELLARYPFAVVLVGAKDEAPVGERLREATGADDRVFNLAGKTTIRQLAAILARARLFIGNDSGPAHLAAAVETPLVVLSGADDPKETSPVATKKQLLYHDELACISCVKNRCPLSGDERMQCMRLITVADVMTAVRTMIGQADS
ncbi:MAG: glycosyltransferase family 9 protein [Candidatus Zixiibacteriota bacterium]|nr:MAG: glycosyltransferase family 9 protein [candidate division Zixibacteria bacterium]